MAIIVSHECVRDKCCINLSLKMDIEHRQIISMFCTYCETLTTHSGCFGCFDSRSWRSSILMISCETHADFVLNQILIHVHVCSSPTLVDNHCVTLPYINQEWYNGSALGVAADEFCVAADDAHPKILHCCGRTWCGEH